MNSLSGKFLSIIVIFFISLILIACGSGKKSDVSIDNNSVPVANAGPDHTQMLGSLISLDGQYSTDVDSNPLTYRWSFSLKPLSSLATLSNSASENPTFVADVVGNYVLSLVVNDGDLDSDPDAIVITIVKPNTAPIANAGPDQTLVVGSLVSLDGHGSIDVDSSPLAYRWSFSSIPANSSAVLSDSVAANSSFVTDVVGNYVLSLMVNDGDLDSDPDAIVITIVKPNTAPIANAGPDQTLVVGSLVSLDGHGSIDVDSSPLAYRWSFSLIPANSSAVLSDSAAADLSFVTDVTGDYVLNLVVNDGNLDSVIDKVIITAATSVGGIVSSDTTWDLANSPYLISSDVQIAYGITLFIEAGVKVIGGDGKIKVWGLLNAKGTKDLKIKFDSVNIVPGNGPANEWFKIDIDFAEVSSGSIYYPTGNAVYGSISLKDSILNNMAYMYVVYPVEDCVIEKNIFINSGGISTGNSNNIKISIRNNVFYQQTDDPGEKYAVKNMVSYDTSETIVEYNTFLNTDRVALMLPGGGYTSTKITAINNYWNTTDTKIIDSMIYDKNDDLSSAGYINYSPFLMTPDPNTPDITPYLP